MNCTFDSNGLKVVHLADLYLYVLLMIFYVQVVAIKGYVIATY